MAILFLFHSWNINASEPKSLKLWFDERQDWLVELDIIIKGEAPLHINQLIRQDSPYLLRHSLQAIDWYAWTDSAFEVAEAQNKLVYLSIGYETCHWCHVISEESYSDLEIVELLNTNYVSIKLDREQYPDIDSKYQRALSAVIENPGWPIQVIMTPSGHILWIDSYTKPTVLLASLKVLAKKWKASPKTLSTLAQARHKQLLPDVTPDLKAISNADLSVKQTQTLEGIRGILKREQQGNGPRFLRANWLLYLLDEMKPDDLLIVETQVKQLLMSPTYDFIDGGMHRYAEDGHWQQPHFEKMLYDQGQLIRVLNRLFLITHNQAYLNFADQVIDFVETRLKQSELYSSSISAISNGVEGGYYRYAYPSDFAKGVESTSLNIQNALLSLTSLELPINEIQNLKSFRQKIERPSVDEKSILAWNAIYLLAVNELYQTTGSPRLRLIVLEGASALMTNYFQNGKLYRIRYKGNTSIDATLNDFAWATLLFTDLYMTFSDEKYAVFVRDISVPFVNQMSTASWENLTIDSEMPSTLGTTLDALDKLKFFKKTADLANLINTIKLDFNIRNTNVNAASVIFSWNQYFEKFPRLSKFFARGKGIASIERLQAGGRLQLKIAKGWHVNAHIPLDSKLIPTVLSNSISGDNFNVAYPNGELRKLGFSEKEMLIYEGNVSIPFNAKHLPNRVNELHLKIQACSDTLCLLPEEIKLSF